MSAVTKVKQPRNGGKKKQEPVKVSIKQTDSIKPANVVKFSESVIANNPVLGERT